jgi:hypothetical protein
VVLSRIFALIVPLAGGALLGAIIGGIITGSDAFIIGWSIGGPFLVILLIVLGLASSSSRKKSAGRRPKPEGINETVTGVEIPAGMPQPEPRASA